MRPGAFSSSAIVLCAAALLAAGPARAQEAGSSGARSAASAGGGPHVFRLTNGGKTGISAVYAAPAGTLNLSDDLLGKQTAAAGKTVTLKVGDHPGTCVFDLQFLMNNGDTVDMKGVDLCASQQVTYGG